MKKCLWVVFLCSISIVPAYAGGFETGNGGGGVVCRTPSGSVESVELFDVYEGRTLRRQGVDLGAVSLSVDEKVEMAMKRLERLSPLRAALYRQEYGTFFSETLFLKGSQLVLIPDADPVAMPAGCAIEQLAVQRVPLFPEDKRYVIDQDLWDRLDSDGKAGLILHELIYREAIQYGHTKSVFARYLNMKLLSNEIENVRTDEDFYHLLANVRFAQSDFNGISVVIYYCDPSQEVKSFCPASNGRTSADAIAADIQFQDHKVAAGRVFLSAHSVLKVGSHEFNTRSDRPSGIVSISFYPSGRIRELSHALYGPPILDLTNFEDNSALELILNPSIRFFDLNSGAVECVSFNGPSVLRSSSGEKRQYGSGRFVFDQDQRVLSYTPQR